MKVKFRLFAELREIAGEKERILEFNKSLTVFEALNILSDFYGERFKERIFKEENPVENFIILVNGVNIKNLNDMKTQLKDGDEVSIFPPVGGG